MNHRLRAVKLFSTSTFILMMICFLSGNNSMVSSLAFTVSPLSKSSRTFLRRAANNRVHGSATRSFSTTPTKENESLTSSSSSSALPSPSCPSFSAFSKTHLASKGASFLHEGLDVYTVPAFSDGHPLAVYGIQSKEPAQFTDFNDNGNKNKGKEESLPILLLHGRTWSSLPVYHLHLQNTSATATVPTNGDATNGGDSRHEKEQSRSLMESLLEKGLQPYAMDFRGFGGTPYDDDENGFVEPNRCVEDAESVLRWIAERHGMISSNLNNTDHNNNSNFWPCLLGWSQGALVAQLLAQRRNPYVSKLILYGSIYDPLVRYPREPLYASKPNRSDTPNTFNDAIEDFTIEGSIPPEPARKFAEAALITDPVKAVWKHLYQFNNCDPARVHIPTLLVAGDQDPYAPLHVQQDLFTNLGRGPDRTWSILAGCDHAVHLLEERDRMINIVVSFVQNGKRSEYSQRHDY